MSKNRIIPVLGGLVALIHIIDGLPQAWESFLGIVLGLGIVGLSFWAQVDKKLKLQAKAQQRTARRVASPVSELSELNQADEARKPEFTKRVTDFYPRTAPPGRRLSDIKPNFEPPRENDTN